MATSLDKITKKGWIRKSENGKLIYTPKNLQPGKTFCFVAFPVAELGKQNLREWLSFKVSNLQNKLGKPDKKWVIKAEKGGTLGTSNTFVNQAGEKLSVGYNGTPVNKTHALLIQMISSNKIDVLLRYGADFNEILKDAQHTLLSANNYEA